MASLAGTGAGFLALLFWAMTIGLSRSLMEKIGTFTAGSLIFLMAGSISCLRYYLRRKATPGRRRFSPLVVTGCGLLFVAYMVFLYSGIGLAGSKLAVLAVALLNYLWPTFIILFSILLLGSRANWLILPGVVVATSGTGLAVTAASGLPAKELFSAFNPNNPVFFLGLGAGITWGLYSVVTRKFAQVSDSGLPFYLLATGLLLGLLRYFFPEQSRWSLTAWGELSFMVIFPTLLAYNLWET
ncbi:MAG TPA: EamA family transporter, partial [bacterium]|nr:EamA family transporter [bacterium]